MLSEFLATLNLFLFTCLVELKATSKYRTKLMTRPHNQSVIKMKPGNDGGAAVVEWRTAHHTAKLNQTKQLSTIKFSYY